jgi:TolA-binding protein
MKDALDDLSPLARRDELSAGEQHELELLLNSSEEARIFHDLGERFDAEDASPAAKSAASEAMVERLMRELPKGAARSSRNVRRSVWLLAAAAVLAASVAGAVLGARLLGSRGAPAPSASSAPSSSAPRSRSATGAAAGDTKDEAAPAPSDAAPDDAAPSEPTPSAAPHSSASAPVPSSATELLSAAGRARRTGQAALAVELLQSLRSRYPNSPEAIASDITLGKLELERGAAAAALSHFDDYLRRAAGGALAPEALWGRSQALTKLGRASEARTSLSQLLERYPSSPYASSARAKLGEGSRP